MVIFDPHQTALVVEDQSFAAVGIAGPLYHLTYSHPGFK